MCGICGLLSKTGPPDRELLLRMIDRLEHRGPDASGYYRDQSVALGHTRLSIIDAEGGAQPMGNPAGTLWVVFNGEIFNFIELRAELEALGRRFRTASDTEVILHAFEEWGLQCFSRFNGQWALALWDRAARSLTLCRDRFGIRPLYLHRGQDRLAFASEVKCLFADTTVTRAMDPAGMAECFTTWSAIAPHTVFKGVEQLEPGTALVIDRTGERVHRYWSPSFPPLGEEPEQDLHENEERLREVVVEACRLRFVRSDVPVGAYLSGGLDSAITAAVIARYTNAPLRTFSLRFDDPEFDEGKFQSRMVDELGAEHTSVVVRPRDIGAAFPDVVRHAESPLLRSAPGPLFMLSRLVHDSGLKVVVTGEGADEILAGYDIFREARLRSFWARDPHSAVRGNAVALLYPWLSRSPSQTPEFARQFFGRNLDPKDPALSHRPRWDSTRAIMRMFTPAWQELTAVDVAAELVGRMPSEQSRWDPLSRGQWLEMTTLLPGYILASQGDRMLMAHSVEGRFPFLDKNVAEFANQLPSRHKLFGLDEKFLLKRAFADLVPDEVRNRSKQPYRSPDASSFFGDRPIDWVAEVLSESAVRSAGVFDPGAVQGLVAKVTRRRGERMSNTDNMRTLGVITTQLIHQQFVAGDENLLSRRIARPQTVIDLAADTQEEPA